MARRSTSAREMANSSGGGVAGEPAKEPGGNDERATHHDRRQGSEAAFGLELRDASLHPLGQPLGSSAGAVGVGLGHLAGVDLELKLVGPLVPVVDLPGEPLLHRCQRVCRPGSRCGAAPGRGAGARPR